MSAAPVAPPAGFAEPGWSPAATTSLFIRRAVTFCLLELRRIRHDRTEIYTRAIQPALWLLIFGETFSAIRAIPSGGKPYLEFLTPGIMAQSALFIAIFYGIQIIWERDAGMLSKLMATPTPRAALVAGKSFAAGVRGMSQVVMILILAAILRIGLDWNPLHLIAAAGIVFLSAGFFSCLSMTIAGLVLSRERLMGIGQAITMPLFFASNALYPVELMPAWVQAITAINPMSYEVDALRGLLIDTPSSMALDIGVIVVAVIAGVTAASLLLGRLTRG